MTTGIETRGVRPDPEKRNALSKWIYIELDRYWRDARVYIAHEILTGVPCGPTLAMVDPSCLGYHYYQSLKEAHAYDDNSS